MKRHKVVLSEGAIADITALVDYIIDQRGSARVARAYARRIRERCLRLGEFPGAGRERSDLGANLRIVPFESAIIVYAVTDETVFITNIFGAPQDYENLLRGP